MVGALLFDTLDGRISIGRLLGRGIKMVLTLLVSLFAYMAVARFATSRLGGLIDYMGISEMGHISLAEIPELVLRCFSTYSSYFWNNNLGYYFDFLKPLLLVELGCGVFILLVLLMSRRIGIVKGLLALALVACYPLAGNLIHVMVAGGAVHELMIYGSVFLLILPVALAYFASSTFAEAGSLRQLIQVPLSWLILIVMSLTSYSYIIADNSAYLKMSVSYEQVYAYSNRLLSAIENSEGYQSGMPLVLVGGSVMNGQIGVPQELNQLWMVGVLDAEQIRVKYSYGEFLQYYLGYPGDIYMPNSANDEFVQAVEEIAAWPQVAAMPTYPQEGSIQCVDGYVIVKLAEPQTES